MGNDLEFNEKLEKIESSVIGEDFDEVSPLAIDLESVDFSSPESISPDVIEMSTCPCTGGCGSNYSHGDCLCTGNCGSNYHK